MTYWLFYSIMVMLDAIYFRTEYQGRDRLPAQGSFIIASNHISNLDPFVLGIILRRRFGFVAKEELFKKKLIGWSFRQMGAISIKRDSSDFRAIRKALRRLRDGIPLILFPEGTRGVSGRNKKIQSGVGFIALKSNVPVFPVYIRDSDKAFPANAKWFRRYQVKVKVGEPIHFQQNQSFEEIASQIMDKVYSLQD